LIFSNVYLQARGHRYFVVIAVFAKLKYFLKMEPETSLQ
jgi:hypothetical protein